MKLGLVLECDTGGPDELVLTCFARRLKQGIEVQTVAHGSKEQLILKGVESAEMLVDASKCDLVIIAWDLKPYWEKTKKKCKDEADILRKSLQGDAQNKIKLLCITWELETWLIADERAINGYLVPKSHKDKFSCNKPKQKDDPKAFLNQYFKKRRGKPGYEDYREAIKIAQYIPDTNRLNRIDSFRRFNKLLTGDPKGQFSSCTDVCKDLVHKTNKFG